MLTKSKIRFLLRNQYSKTVYIPGGINKLADAVYNNYLNKSWDNIFCYFNKEMIFPVFLEIHNELSDKDYWKILRQALQGESYLTSLFNVVWYLLENPSRDSANRKYLMNSKERSYLDNLKSKKIYRGCKEDFEFGFSWTLNKKVAMHFAQRQAGFVNVKLLEADFDKSLAYAYFSGRKEQEILIHPRHLNKITVVKQFDVENDKTGILYIHYNQHLDSQKCIKKSKIFQKTNSELESNKNIFDLDWYEKVYKPRILARL